MRFIYLILILLLTSCGIQWQYTTLNHVGYADGIYRSSDYKVDTISSVSDLEWKLRTDFNFRYDFAQYALSQPRSFDWNNRILGNRYNNYNPYWGQSYYWNRDQMWNDWVWGYSYPNFGWNSWYNRNRSYYYYGWYGYNSWNNGPWNNLGYNVVWNSSRRNNVTYVNGYRTSNRTSTRTVVSNTNRRTSPTTNNRTIIVKKPRVNYNNKPRINTPPRRTPTIRTTPSRPTRSSNNNTVRINSRRKN
jgi:hypothetical protein